jgi:3,4-dihydroxy 2-butanone 4-phosphate synthase
VEVTSVFTGRISEVGAIVELDDDGVAVAAPKTAAGLRPGGSVAVSGVCLTATHVDEDGFRAALVGETRRRSVAGEWRPADPVNLELPLRAGDPLDGHLVQGHVDAVGKVMAGREDGPGQRVWIRPPTRFLGEIVAKGSVAVDGVSLTVAEVVRDRFSVALIPTTLAETTLGAAAVGDPVNLEMDVLAKYVERLLGAGK